MATIISKMTDWLSEKTEKAPVFVNQGQEKEAGEMGSDDSRGKLNGDGREENGDKDIEMNTVLNGQD